MTNKEWSPRSGRQKVAPGESANRGKDDEQRVEPAQRATESSPGESANRGKDDEQRVEPAQRATES
ncbi:MAG TPA: hypothetical protein VKM94_18320, partial [Blastocatellia bacterium]|nr:hypothetical protein [Blastocatellia bacterium]